MASKIEDRPHFIESLRAHPSREPLSKLARRVFDRFAEVRTTSVSREFVGALADELGVTHETSVDGIRLRSVLERGPSSPDEWAVVIGFALDRISPEIEGEGAQRARKFVRQADALESLGVDVYGWVAAAMSETAAARAGAAMVDLTLEDDTDGRAGRARAYSRVEALRTFGRDEDRERLAAGLADSPLGGVLGTKAVSRSSFRFRANTAPVPPTNRTLGALRLVSGLALLQWIARGLGALLGLRSEADVQVDPLGIVIESQTTMGGRVLRRRVERFSRSALVGAAHATRFPAVHLLVGAAALAIGLVLGGVVVVDGVRSGETMLLLLGAALMLAGSALDLLFSVVIPAARGRAVLEMVVAPNRVVRLVDVLEADAFATLDAVHAPAQARASAR